MQSYLHLCNPNPTLDCFKLHTSISTLIAWRISTSSLVQFVFDPFSHPVILTGKGVNDEVHAQELHTSPRDPLDCNSEDHDTLPPYLCHSGRNIVFSFDTVRGRLHSHQLRKNFSTHASPHYNFHARVHPISDRGRTSEVSHKCPLSCHFQEVSSDIWTYSRSWTTSGIPFDLQIRTTLQHAPYGATGFSVPRLSYPSSNSPPRPLLPPTVDRTDGVFLSRQSRGITPLVITFAFLESPRSLLSDSTTSWTRGRRCHTFVHYESYNPNYQKCKLHHLRHVPPFPSSSLYLLCLSFPLQRFYCSRSNVSASVHTSGQLGMLRSTYIYGLSLIHKLMWLSMSNVCTWPPLLPALALMTMSLCRHMYSLLRVLSHLLFPIFACLIHLQTTRYKFPRQFATLYFKLERHTGYIDERTSLKPTEKGR